MEKHLFLSITASQIHQPQSPNERFLIRQQQCLCWLVGTWTDVCRSWWKDCFWIQWTCSQVFSNSFYFLQKNIRVLAAFKLNDFAGKCATQFHLWHLCTWSDVSCVSCRSFSKHSYITKIGTTWLFSYCMGQNLAKEEFITNKRKIAKIFLDLGIFGSVLKSLVKSLNQNAQSIRVCQ